MPRKEGTVWNFQHQPARFSFHWFPGNMITFCGGAFTHIIFHHCPHICFNIHYWNQLSDIPVEYFTPVISFVVYTLVQVVVCMHFCTGICRYMSTCIYRIYLIYCLLQVYCSSRGISMSTYTCKHLDSTHTYHILLHVQYLHTVIHFLIHQHF